jgi:hypothetical protein
MKLAILTLALVGWATTAPAAAQSGAREPVHELAIRDGSVSVRVSEGSLLALVEELGRRLGFEVIAHGVEDKSITVDFEQFNERQAIRAICQRVGYVQVPDPVTGETVRLVLTPSRNGRANRLAARLDPLPPRPEEPIIDPFEDAPPPEEPPADEPPADEPPPDLPDDSGGDRP